MQILKAYKFRLKPTEQQAQRLRQLVVLVMSGITGWQRQTHSGCWRKLPSAFELNRMLTSWKKDPEMAFLTEAYTDNLQQKLKDLHGRGCAALIRNRRQGTRFQEKSDNRDAIRLRQL